MYYRKALREAGFDPDKIEQAKAEDEFVLHIGPKELKGSVVGDPMKCAGARACQQQQHVTFAWIGASVAILAFPDGRIVKYEHNGHIPKKQDEGMFPIGEYKFKRVSDHDLPKARQVRDLAYETKRGKRNRSNNASPIAHENMGIKKSVSFHPKASAAWMMRRSWEVEAK